MIHPDSIRSDPFLSDPFPKVFANISPTLRDVYPQKKERKKQRGGHLVSHEFLPRPSIVCDRIDDMFDQMAGGLTDRKRDRHTVQTDGRMDGPISLQFCTSPLLLASHRLASDRTGQSSCLLFRFLK